MISIKYRSHLFCSFDLDTFLCQQLYDIQSQIDRIPKNQFLSTPYGDMVTHFISINNIDPLVIYDNNITQSEPEECKVDVSRDKSRFIRNHDGPFFIHGFAITIELPFSGDHRLWGAKTSPWCSMFPYGDITNNSGESTGILRMAYSFPHDLDTKELRSEFESNLDLVKRYVSWSKDQVESYNKSLEGTVTRAIDLRRKRLEKESSITSMIGIPLKKKEGSPSFEPIKIHKMRVKPLPDVPTTKFRPEPGIDDAQYKSILRFIKYSGTSFEKTPRTYAIHSEEELRDIIISNLNSAYEGGATGETFNKAGKTDILISQDGKSAFIAECKIWRGAKALSQSINQLLSYLTWRDCKTALIIFNKNNKDFSNILKLIQSSIEGHPNFYYFDNQNDVNEWHFTMKSKDDEGLLVRMRVMVFNLYCSV